MEKEPTLRQKKLAELMLANVSSGLYKSKKEMLLACGYSEGMAKQPSRILNSPSFILLMVFEIPMELRMVDMLKEGLMCNKKDGTPDYRRRFQYLHLIYQLKGYIK